MSIFRLLPWKLVAAKPDAVKVDRRLRWRKRCSLEVRRLRAFRRTFYNVSSGTAGTG